MSDTLNKFLFENFAVRGELIQLDDVWARALEHTDYSPQLRAITGQMIAATGLLSATIKYKGQLTFQIQAPPQANTPLRLLVAQGTDTLGLRGIAQLRDGYSGKEPETGSPIDWVGQGQAVMTIRHDDQPKPYQGLVPLEGNSVAQVLEGYFQRSEQLPTRLWLAADGNKAVGLLLQKLPGESDDDKDGWNRVVKLAETIKDEELLGLSVTDILHRLYHEEDLRVFPAKPVHFNCNGCEQRFVEALTNMGREELDSIVVEQGQIEIACDFCNRQFRYDAVDVEQMFLKVVPVAASKTEQ